MYFKTRAERIAAAETLMKAFPPKPTTKRRRKGTTRKQRQDRAYAEFIASEDYPLLRGFGRISGFDFTAIGYWLQNKKDRKHYPVGRHGHLPDKMLWKHMVVGDAVVSQVRFSHTFITPLEIDDHEGTVDSFSAFKALVAEVGEPFYAEYSFESNSYHIFYDWGAFVSDELLESFHDYMETKYGYNIEVVRRSDHLRLPYSKPYREAGTYDRNSPTLIDPVKDWKGMVRSFWGRKPIAYPAVFRELAAEAEKAPKTRKPSNTDWDRVRFGNGNRHKTMWKLILHYLQTGIVGEEELYQAVRRHHDGTSKDWKASDDDDGRQLVAGMAMQAMIYLEKEGRTAGSWDEFLNSELPEEEQRALRELFRAVFPKFSFTKKLLGKSQERMTNDLMTLYAVLRNNAEYRSAEGIEYHTPEMVWANVRGVAPVSLNYLKKIQDKFGIKNPRKLIQLLVASGCVCEVFDLKGRGHDYKRLHFCNHYFVNDANVIREGLRSLMSAEEFDTIVALETADEDVLESIVRVPNVAELHKMKPETRLPPEWRFNRLSDPIYERKAERARLDSRGTTMDERLSKIRERDFQIVDSRPVRKHKEEKIEAA